MAFGCRSLRLGRRPDIITERTVLFGIVYPIYRLNDKAKIRNYLQICKFSVRNLWNFKSKTRAKAVRESL